MQTIIFNRQQFTSLANECLHNIKSNTTYNFSFEEAKSPKTLKQLSFLFGAIVSSLQNYYLETDGELYDKVLIKELLYDAIGVDSVLCLPTGKKIVYKKSLSKMSKSEAKEFINRCIDWITLNTDCILSPSIRYLWTASISDEEIERLLSYKFPEKDEFYLRTLRNGVCINCGKPATEVHHLRKGAYSIAKKNPDYLGIGICAECHRELHNKGEQPFIDNIQKNIINNMPIDLFCKLNYQKIRNGYE